MQDDIHFNDSVAQFMQKLRVNVQTLKAVVDQG